MIEFKILATVDKGQQASYSHHESEISFGSAEADMVIDDPAIGETQFRVFQEGGQFFVENLNEELELRLNGKPISGKAPLKAKDSVVAGKTTIQFSRLDLGPPQPPERYEHPMAAQRFSKDSKEKAVLDVLEFLAGQSGSPAGPPPLPGEAPRPPLPGGAPKSPMPPPLPKR